MSRSNRPPQPKGQVPNYQPKAKIAPEIVLDLLPCIICKGEVKQGYHGRWGNGGTCDGACEKKQEAKYPYGEHTEENFFKKFNLE
jgi:hypothetical protein